MLTPEFAKVVFEFCSPSRLVDLAKTIISFSEEASQVGSPLFGVIYPWHSDDPLIELADTIKLQQELVWIQEQRSNVLTALQELETDPTNVALLDNFVSQADDLLEKLTAWLSDLSGLSEDMWYHIFNQMLEFGSYEVNYYNLFLHVGMEACRFESGTSRPDFLIARVIDLGGLDPNGYPEDMLIKKYPVINK